ncbi:hypothetical protein IMSAGC009_01243 [Lachnospiraceae bacterium]|jgi:hypothetical protein|nr:hypothetical protein [uncultured Schaedlerella sp.]GFI16082.1 hypothetical protein IMSAGC009_01243 [Lachnospiraceae bacterium]
MNVNGIDNNTGINSNYMMGKKRVLGNNFNIQIEDINRGSKVNEPLMSFLNPKTGESVEIHRSDIYSDDMPIYILKGKTAEGKEFERMHHAWIIDPRNCSYAELMMLNQETGNTSLGDKQRADILFEKTGVKNYLDKADYSAAIKGVMEEYKSSGNWDAYLSMDKRQQSLNDYTSVPVYFDRSIMGQNTMERNGVKGSCSFATVRTAEEIQKEIDDRVKAAEKNGPTLREALANAFPNAVNTLYSFVGSSVVMTFDEYVKAMEEMLRKSNEEANVSLIK